MFRTHAKWIALIVINFTQHSRPFTRSQFASVANVTFPSVYQEFLDGIDLVNFDLSWLLSAGCIIDVNFHEPLLMSTIGPIVGMAILGVTYILASRRSENLRDQARQKHLYVVLLLTFVVYSPVSSILFQMFACDRLDDGGYYLRADYRIECDSSAHEWLQVYACCMIILYTVGIPMFYGILLFRNREVLIDKNAREGNLMAKTTSGLWEAYEPPCFYYELIECGRRIVLTGIVVFIYPNTAAQVAITLAIAICFMVISEALAPYASGWDTWVSRVGQAIVFTSMYVALLLKLDVSDEGATSQRAYEIILVIANSSLILAVVVEAGVTVGPLLVEHRNLARELEDIESVTSSQ